MKIEEYAERRIKEDPSKEAQVQDLVATWKAKTVTDPEAYPPGYDCGYDDWLDQEEAHQWLRDEGLSP